MNPFQTSLLIPFSNIEDQFGTFRKTSYFDWPMFGMMAHLTLIFPFKDKEKIDTAVLQTLTDLFSNQAPIPYTLSEFGHFPNTLYLKVEDETPFISLINNIVAKFPEHPPYGGQFSDTVPHITMAKSHTSHLLEQIESQFWQQFPNSLPLTGVADTVWLVDITSSDSYEIQETFTLTG